MYKSKTAIAGVLVANVTWCCAISLAGTEFTGCADGTGQIPRLSMLVCGEDCERLCVRIENGPANSLAHLYIGLNQDALQITQSCALSIGPLAYPNAVTVPLDEDGNTYIEFPLPQLMSTGVVYVQALFPDSTTADGLSASNAYTLPIGMHYSYGAKYEPPDGKVIHGLGLSLTPNANEDYLGALNNDPRLAPLLRTIYINVGDGESRPWPLVMNTLRNALAEAKANGHYVHLGLAYQGEPETHGPFFGQDGEVVNMLEPYISRIRSIADEVRFYGVPVYLRLAGEFNGWWNGYSQYTYTKAFQVTVDIFREHGADNVATVWCWAPAGGTPTDFDDCTLEPFIGVCKWYPGPDYVDWFGLDLFKYIEFTGPAIGEDGKSSLHGNVVKFLQMAEDEGKPVLLNELSMTELDITPDFEDGVNDWALWYERFFAFLEDNPNIKGMVYLNNEWAKIPKYNSIQWKNANIAHNDYIADQYRQTLEQCRFLHLPDKDLID